MKKELTVIKVGGKVIENEEALSRMLDGFCRIQGPRVLVCGGGVMASALAAQMGIESRMVDGRRITDAETLKVVTMVYAGLVNKNVVAKLNARGVNAIGLSGADLDCIRCDKRPVGKVDYGFVGDVKAVNAGAFSLLIDGGAVPVVCAITHDGNGQLLNTNADTVASSVASALAEIYDVTLTFCFDKPGVLMDASDDSSVVPVMRRTDFERMKAEGIVSDGMIPKLENAYKAIDAGVKRIVITNAAGLGTDSGTVIL